MNSNDHLSRSPFVPQLCSDLASDAQECKLILPPKVELEKRLPLAKKINPNIDPEEVEALNQTLYLALVRPRIQEPLKPADLQIDI